MCFGDGVLFGARVNEFTCLLRLNPYGVEAKGNQALKGTFRGYVRPETKASLSWPG